MPAPIEDIIKKRVVEQWLGGEARDKIAADNNIGEGTVSSIVSEFKIGLDNSEFDSARELALSAKKQGMTLSELSSNYRLYNFVKSGASEEKVESFITNVSSNDVPPKKVIELVNRLHEISKTESIPLDQIPSYIERKLEEKQKIDEGIKEADAILQSKNVNIETVDEYIRVSKKLNEYSLSFHDTDKLLNVLTNTKEIGFDGKKIVAKLRKIKRLDKKEKALEDNCTILSRTIEEYKEIVPLAKNCGYEYWYKGAIGF